MRRKRRNYSSAFKAMVALVAVKGERTVAELALLSVQVVINSVMDALKSAVNAAAGIALL